MLPPHENRKNGQRLWSNKIYLWNLIITQQDFANRNSVRIRSALQCFAKQCMMERDLLLRFFEAKTINELPHRSVLEKKAELKQAEY